jgi:hypothetical protein
MKVSTVDKFRKLDNIDVEDAVWDNKGDITSDTVPIEEVSLYMVEKVLDAINNNDDVYPILSQISDVYAERLKDNIVKTVAKVVNAEATDIYKDYKVDMETRIVVTLGSYYELFSNLPSKLKVSTNFEAVAIRNVLKMYEPKILQLSTVYAVLKNDRLHGKEKSKLKHSARQLKAEIVADVSMRIEPHIHNAQKLEKVSHRIVKHILNI